MTVEPARPHALVTGASSGIGEAFARQLAPKHDLVLVARRKDRLDALAAELAERHGAGVQIIAADLSTDSAVSEIEQRIAQGDIELLVNNAGFGTSGEFARLPLDRELEELDVNIRALVRLTRAALPPMVGRGRGGIINIASMGAFQPVPYMATYAATKAFVLHFSEGLHEELKKSGVTVTCLCPGPVRTEFQQTAGLDESRMPGMGWATPDTVVRTALKALAARRAIVVPGGMNVAASAFAKVAPRSLARRVAGAMFRDAGTK